MGRRPRDFPPAPNQLGQLVHATLDHLPGRYGEALEWRYIEGLSVPEIAERLDLGYKATESVLSRARKAFRDGFALAGGRGGGVPRAAGRDRGGPRRVMQDGTERGPGPGARSDRDDEAELLLRAAGPRVEVPPDTGGARPSAGAGALAVGGATASPASAVAHARGLRRRGRPHPPGDAVDSARSARAPPAAPVAVVERIDGVVRGGGVEADGARPRTLDVDGVVRAGEAVATVASSRAALRLDGGVSLRLDTGSEAVLHSATVIELLDGAVYVDSGDELAGVEIRTPWGTARDIGTQFEVKLSRASLRLRVRSGLVELWRGDEPIAARPGTELTVTDAGTVSAPVSPVGAAWEWVVDVAPAFEIDGRPLASFLGWASGELGRTVRYADPALATEARSTVLHGSIAGLALADALSVTLTTSGLDHRLEDETLLVIRPSDDPGTGSRR